MMSFISRLLTIRLKQAWRAVCSVGWLLIIGLPLVIVLWLVLWSKMAGMTGWQVSLLTSAGIFSLHWNRKDLAFLRKCGQRPVLILLVEYQLLLLFLITLPLGLIYHTWSNSGYAHLAAAIIPWVPVPGRTRVGKTIDLSRFLGNNVEWIGGIRRQRWTMLFLYLAGLFSSMFIPGVLLSIITLLMIALGFYNEFESRTLLENQLKPQFLWKKWIRHFRLFCVLMSPQIGLFLIFHPQYWYLAAFLLSVSGIFLGCAIFYKYSAYLPNRRQANNQTPISLMFVTLLIPFLAPLSLIAFFVLHRKAQQRLQYFFPHA